MLEGDIIFYGGYKKKNIISKYSFILQIYELVDPSEIRKNANKLKTLYKHDLESR